MPSWSSLPDMIRGARRYHGAARDAQGRSYAMGGDGASEGVTTVDRYDPATNQWSAAPSMLVERVNFGCATDGSGRIYAFGGYSFSGGRNSVERFDPSSGAWTSLPAMPYTAYGNVGASDNQGRIYSFGGAGGNQTADAFRFTPSAGTWASIAAAPFTLYGAAAIGDSRGRVYVCGGYSPPKAQAAYFDTGTGQWVTLPSMSTGRGFFGLAVDGADRIYAFGGYGDGTNITNTVERYDPVANQWTVIGTMPQGRYGHGVVTESGGRFNIFGGTINVGGNTQTTATAIRDTENSAPNTATGTAPVGSQRVDRTQPTPLQWQFTDPDAGDTQSRADVRYRIGTGAWTTITNAATTASTYSIPANTFAAEANPGWQVLTYDSQGVPAGAWSTEQFFTAADPTATPAFTDPTNAGTIPASSYLVKWSSPNQDAYQLRRLADAAGSPADPTVPANVYADTGVIEDASARQRQTAFETNNRTEHLQLRVRKGGLWSSWASVKVTVSFTPPATPTLVLTPVRSRPEFYGVDALDVAITNPAPTGNQPTVVSHDVYIDDGTVENLRRVATGVAAGATFRWPWPTAGRDYQLGRVRVVAIAANGTTSTASS